MRGVAATYVDEVRVVIDDLTLVNVDEVVEASLLDTLLTASLALDIDEDDPLLPDVCVVDEEVDDDM